MSELPRADYIKAGVFEGDLISREALKKKFDEYIKANPNISGIFELGKIIIDNAPAFENITVFTESTDEKAIADLKEELQKIIAEKRQKGEWINVFDRFSCPFCKMSIKDEVHYLYSKEYRFNYCPNCGASLKGGAENE